MHVLRRYTDLNENEIAALSDEDVKKYVEIEMAYNGIPRLPEHPGPKPIIISSYFGISCPGRF